MSTRFGAWVRRARLEARFGRPMPTNTTSPSASSRAATDAIISSGVYSVAVIDSRAALLPCLEPLQQSRLLLHVLGPGLHAIDELVEIMRQLALVPRDRFPAHVEVVVPIVIALRVRWMRAPRLDDYGTHDRRRNERAIGIRANHSLVHQLLDDDDHALRGKRGLFLHSQEAPDLRVALRVGALRVHDRHIG